MSEPLTKAWCNVCRMFTDHITAAHNPEFDPNELFAVWWDEEGCHFEQNNLDLAREAFMQGFLKGQDAGKS